MTAPSTLEARLAGTRAGAVREEYLSNSAYFPIANILFELLHEGWRKFLRSPDPYTLFVTGLVQAWFLGSWRHAGRPRPLLGNLIGPAFYTVVEGIQEGGRFFDGAPPRRLLGVRGRDRVARRRSALRSGSARASASRAMLAENVVRAAIIVVMYAIFEAFDKPAEPDRRGLPRGLEPCLHRAGAPRARAS